MLRKLTFQWKMIAFECRISIPPLQVCRSTKQWELKTPTDGSLSDCVHEQVAKADCECPLYINEERRKQSMINPAAANESNERQKISL